MKNRTQKSIWALLALLAALTLAPSAEGSTGNFMTAVLQTIPAAETNPFGHNVFTVDKPLVIDLLVTVTGGRMREPAAAYKVTNFWNQVVDEGTLVPRMTGTMGRITYTPSVALEPGWYRLQLELSNAGQPVPFTYRPGTDRTYDQEPFITFAVLPAMPEMPESQSGSFRQTLFAVDAAMSWLVGSDKFGGLADLVRLSGVSWVRDRMSWTAVEGKQGKFEWGIYAQSAAAQHEAGINVLQVYHNAPNWAKSRSEMKVPDDLIAVYNFSKAVAERFAGEVQAWEFWNEHDHTFSLEPGDHYAAAFKAAALGFKAGGGDGGGDGGGSGVQVAFGPLAHTPGLYADLVMRNGVAPYMDIYTFHTYADATKSTYEQFLDEHVRFIEKWQIWDREVWITESGRHFIPSPGSPYMPAAEAQVHYLVRAFTKSAAAGIDRFFWFVLPHFMRPENIGGRQSGILRADLTPHPAYVALATITRMLGEGRYLGEIKLEGGLVHVFDSGAGQVAVAWTEGSPVTLRVPEKLGRPLVTDVMGRTSAEAISLVNDVYTIQVGNWPVYITGVAWPADDIMRPANLIKRDTVRTQAVAGSGDSGSGNGSAGDAATLSPIVLFPRWDRNLLPAGELESPPLGYNLPLIGTDFQLEVYNFSEETWRGLIKPEFTPGFAFAPSEAPVEVAPMSKAVLSFHMQVPTGLLAEDYYITINGYNADGSLASTSVSRFVVDWSQRGKYIAITDALKMNMPSWTPYIASHGTTRIRQTREDYTKGLATFEHRFSGQGDRWAYPYMQFRVPVDLSGFAGIRFRITGETTGGATCQFSVLDGGNRRYFPPQPYKLLDGPQEMVFLFADLFQPNWLDVRGPLDLSSIKRIYFGCNPTADVVSYQINSIELLER